MTDCLLPNTWVLLRVSVPRPQMESLCFKTFYIAPFSQNISKEWKGYQSKMYDLIFCSEIKRKIKGFPHTVWKEQKLTDEYVSFLETFLISFSTISVFRKTISSNSIPWSRALQGSRFPRVSFWKPNFAGFSNYRQIQWKHSWFRTHGQPRTFRCQLLINIWASCL